MADALLTQSPCVIVLGMHRSGTSLLTGSLEAAGLYLGEVNNEAPFNRKGNKENESIRELNDALLERNGAAWNRPPNGQAQWSGADEEWSRSLISSYLRPPPGLAKCSSYPPSESHVARVMANALLSFCSSRLFRSCAPAQTLME